MNETDFYEKNMLASILPQEGKNIIVLGSRKMSFYGYRIIKYFVPKLVKNNYTIINGFSSGCETEVLLEVLSSGGKAIGVMPYGSEFIKNDYNYKNITKFMKHKNSLLIFPFKKEEKPCKYTFYYRNYLMLMMAKFVLILEASVDSKVYYLVDTALNMGKEIYCVPGNIFYKNSKGCNNMIKDGANLISDIDDLVL